MHRTHEHGCRGRKMRGRGYGPRGHRARRGDVRSAILTLLGEKPMHGYEMIQELEDRTGGRWRPSAGSIYPTLQLLEDEGLVRATRLRASASSISPTQGASASRSDPTRTPPWDQDFAGLRPATSSAPRPSGFARR